MLDIQSFTRAVRFGKVSVRAHVNTALFCAYEVTGSVTSNVTQLCEAMMEDMHASCLTTLWYTALSTFEYAAEPQSRNSAEARMHNPCMVKHVCPFLRTGGPRS